MILNCGIRRHLLGSRVRRNPTPRRRSTSWWQRDHWQVEAVVAPIGSLEAVSSHCLCLTGPFVAFWIPVLLSPSFKRKPGSCPKPDGRETHPLSSPWAKACPLPPRAVVPDRYCFERTGAACASAIPSGDCNAVSQMNPCPPDAFVSTLGLFARPAFGSVFCSCLDIPNGMAVASHQHLSLAMPLR